MKIEIGESLCYSYLRHVKGCWLVQTNWKASEHWTKRKTDTELEAMFQEMRERFDVDGDVFKKTVSVGQFMQQAEIDVIGIDQDGNIHAIDVAFHEAGLNYGGGVANRILKKMLRAYVLLAAYNPPGSKLQIYFVSPKVHKRVQTDLESAFADLREQYSETDWHLITNEDCHNQIVIPTLENAGSVADTAELFVRASKLLNLSGTYKAQPQPSLSHHHHSRESWNLPDESVGPITPALESRVQPLVQDLMRTLLEESPSLLDDADLRNLMDSEYCKNQLALKIGNHALLRERQQGRKVGGHYRYWAHPYAGKLYVCNDWWKSNHAHNANYLLRFLKELARSKPNHPDLPKLGPHIARFREFIEAGN